MSEQGIITPGICAGELTLNDWYLHTPAYDVTNVFVLWVRPSRRWGNTTIPGIPGDHPNPVRVAAAKYSMKMLVSGVYDSAGVHWETNGYSSPYEGLEHTINELEENVWEPATPPDATVPASVLKPSGETREAPAQVVQVDAEQAEGSPLARVVFDLLVPVGAFSVAAS